MEDRQADGVQWSTKVRKPLGEWWKNYIFLQQDLDHSNVATIEDPTTHGKALKYNKANKWEVAMEGEHNPLLTNGTWLLNPVSKCCKAVGCKWVFKAKKDAAGKIVPQKAILVAEESSQL